MTSISYPEFYSALNGIRCLAVNCPNMSLEQVHWDQWAFKDDGCIYVEPMERGLDNLGSVMFWNVMARDNAGLLYRTVSGEWLQ